MCSLREVPICFFFFFFVKRFCFSPVTNFASHYPIPSPLRGGSTKRLLHGEYFFLLHGEFFFLLGSGVLLSGVEPVKQRENFVFFFQWSDKKFIFLMNLQFFFFFFQWSNEKISFFFSMKWQENSFFSMNKQFFFQWSDNYYFFFSMNQSFFLNEATKFFSLFSFFSEATENFFIFFSEATKMFFVASLVLLLIHNFFLRESRYHD